MAFRLHSQINAYKDVMMKRFRHMIFGLLVIAVALPVGATSARAAQNTSNKTWLLQSQSNWLAQKPVLRQNYVQNQSKRKISRSRAKAAAMSRYRGAKFIDVQLVNQSTYRVRLQLQNSKLVDVYVDAYTGQVKN